MAHHLAELVLAAQNDATTTIEQRQLIVDTILRVWAHRHHYLGQAPLADFSSVLTALDRLGQDSPWKFSQPFGPDIQLPDPSASDLPLVETVTELEQLTRETLIRLIYIAARNAEENNQEWLELACKAESNLEGNTTTTLSRLYRSITRRHNDERNPREDTEGPVDGETGNAREDIAEDTAAHGNTEEASQGSSKNQLVNEDLFDDEDDYMSNPLSDITHAQRLREMANLLNRVADTLSASEPSE